MLYRVSLVIEVGLAAILFAMVIERPVRWIERHGAPKAMAIILIDVAILAVFIVPAAALAPSASHEIDRFRQEEPARLRKMDAKWATSDHSLLRGPGRRVLKRAIDELEKPPSNTAPPADVMYRALKIVLQFLALLVIAFFYLQEKDFLHRVILDYVNPRHRDRVVRVGTAVEASVSG